MHTAGCRFTLDRAGYFGSAKHSVSLTAEIISHNPMLVLSPAESFSLPALHIGAVQGGLDEAVNAMHAHTRKTTMPEADPTGCLVIGSIGELRADTDAEKVKAYAREFAALGAEIFVIDAGWQCPLGRHEHRAFNGTNRTAPARFSLGLAEISDYCHSLGMKFGIWTEIERIGNLSPVYEEHPEWRGVSMYGDRSEAYLDMTIPEAAEWAESELSRIIEESRLDLLRIDHVNPGSVHFSMRDRGTGVNECLSLRHYEAVYAMYRRLKKKYPDMIFENCAGGGGRTDLGIMQSFNHTWVSDNQMLPSSVLIGNGMTLALPPERVDRLFGGMFNHYYGSFDAHIRACMLTHMSFMTFFELGEDKNPEQYELARHSIELYKSFIRKILPTCRTFHHTPEFLECQRGGSA
ncbi:MAG: alpha-galactosidase [Clostridia bacterium]|nr:alpha-galactosidase [Clostridia bacterium]